MPKDNIVKDTNVTKLEDTMFGDIDMMRSFLLRPKGFNNAEGLSTIRWSDIARCYSATIPSTVRPAATALPTGHLSGTALARVGATMRMTFGAPASAINRQRSGRTGRSVVALATKISVTSAFRMAAAASRADLSHLLKQHHFLQARHSGMGWLLFNQEHSDRLVLRWRIQRLQAGGFECC